MFYNETGEAIENNRAIFPLISLNKKGDGIRCLGTGFFVNPMGWFVTARHVLVDKSDKLLEDIMATQTLEDGTFVNRFIDQLCIDDKIDIAIGILRTQGYDTSAKPIRIEGTPFLRLSFKRLNLSDEISGYGYPRTTKTINGNKESFHFNGIWSKGKITEFYPDGVGLLKSMCIQTSMKIDDGASGGPVFKDNYVIGVNSTGYELEEGQIPISFITPVHHLINYQLELNSQRIDIRKLISLNHINAIQ